MKRTCLITLIFFLLFTTGCQMTNRTPKQLGTPPPNNEQRQKVQDITFSDQRNQGNRANQNDELPKDVADRLVQLALKNPDVHDATAVVLGDYAVVGIDLTNDLDRSRVGTIKYSVAQALKEDPKGAYAVVTSDPDIVQRLREMAADIRDGRPIKGFLEELSDIVARIMPQFPREVERDENER